MFVAHARAQARQRAHGVAAHLGEDVVQNHLAQRRRDLVARVAQQPQGKGRRGAIGALYGAFVELDDAPTRVAEQLPENKSSGAKALPDAKKS